MKRTIVGRVKSNESRDVTKVKSEGVGDNRTEHVVREKAYYIRVLDEDTRLPACRRKTEPWSGRPRFPRPRVSAPETG